MIKKFILIFFISLGLFFSFYRLSEQYIFEYDRERDYYDVKSIVVNHKVPLIGMTVNSFIYLGPWFNFIQVPFFALLGGDPIYGAYLIATVNFAVFLLIYYLIKRLTFSQLTAICAALLWVSSANQINWTVPLVPLFFLLFILLYEIIKQKPSLFFVSSITLIWSLSLHFHPQMIFLAPVWLFVVISFFQKVKKHPLRSVLYILIAFVIPLLPLIVFDLRHSFLDTKAVLNFFTQNSSQTSPDPGFRPLYSLRQFSLPLVLPFPWLKHNILFSSFLFAIAVYAVIKKPRFFYLLFISLVSLFLMGFYRQNTWPEYYHLAGGMSLMILLFLFSSEKTSSKCILLSLTILIVSVNLRFLLSYAEPTSYYFKRQVIQYMLEQNKPYERMNIENDFPFGEGLGFRPIREFYEKSTGQYPPTLRFYVSYAGSPRQNSTEKIFGAYGVSIINTRP